MGVGFDFTKHLMSNTHICASQLAKVDVGRPWQGFHFADNRGPEALNQPDLLEVIQLRRQCQDMNPLLVSEICVLAIATPLSH